MRRVGTERDYGLAPPRFRLPDGTRVGRVHLQVGDLSRSIAYYQEVLGFDVAHAGPTSASLQPHASHDVLLELHERRGARAVPKNGVLGLYHFAILLPSRAALGRFIAHLAQRGVPFAAADHFVSEATYLWDPDGLGIEVYADRPRDAWRSSGRELLMTTERLDTRSLVDAAAQEPWTGMPAGTTMGHVHLSVGDLVEARRFYHDGLGLELTVWSYPGALFMSASGYHHHLGTNTWAAGARRPDENDARLMEWALVVPGAATVQAAAENVRDAGYTVEDGVMIDPWGTALRLVVDAAGAAEATGGGAGARRTDVPGVIPASRSLPPEARTRGIPPVRQDRSPRRR